MRSTPPHPGYEVFDTPDDEWPELAILIDVVDNPDRVGTFSCLPRHVVVVRDVYIRRADSDEWESPAVAQLTEERAAAIEKRLEEDLKDVYDRAPVDMVVDLYFPPEHAALHRGRED